MPPLDPSIVQSVLDQNGIAVLPFPPKAIRAGVDIEKYRLVLTRANSSDLKLISSWIQNDQEYQWLGGKHPKDRKLELERWISSDLGSYVLRKEAVNASGGGTAIAFANIAQFGEYGEHPEVGRVVVKSAERNKGYGRALVAHLGDAIFHFKSGDLLAHARVHANNENALKMFDKTLFDRELKPEWAPNHPNCVWYAYGVRKSEEFGKVLARLREETDISQGTLAYICSVSRATISAVERGTKEPSWNNLRRMVSALNLDPIQKIELLLAILGEKPPPLLTIPTSIAAELAGKHGHKRNLWILAQEPIEAVDRSVLLGTAEALVEGYQRYYFIPPGVWHSHAGEGLHKRIQEAVTDLTAELHPEESKERTASALQNLRFYEAPAAICSMSIAIKNAPSQGQLTGFWSPKTEVTVGRDPSARLGLNKAEGEELIRKIYVVIGGTNVEGFRQLA